MSVDKLDNNDDEVKEAVTFLSGKLECSTDDFEWDSEAKSVKFTIWSEHEFNLDRKTFLAFASEAKAYKVEEERFIRTPKRTLMLVEPVSIKAKFISYYQGKNLNFKSGKGITMHFHPVNTLIAFVACMEEAWADWHPPEQYPCLEILYSDKTEKKSASEEEQMFNSFMFELASAQDIVFAPSCLRYDLEYNPFEELEGKVFVTSLHPLEAFNEGMRLYLAATRVDEPELELLSYYKVLEYFGPIAMALESNEAMRKKLDSPEALNPDANFLKSIFELAKSAEKRKNDKELIRVVLETCVDFVDIAKELLEPLKKQLTYDDRKAIGEHAKTVAEALYATRNQVAHAKSNYQLQGIELAPAHLPQFNKFLKASAMRAIRWYGRLPAHLKLTF